MVLLLSFIIVYDIIIIIDNKSQEVLYKICQDISKLTFDIAGDSLTMLAILKIYFMERKYNERNYNRETYFE